MSVEAVVGVVGFATAALGTCGAVPNATWRFLRNARRIAVELRDRVRDWWPWPRSQPPEQVALAPVELALGAAGGLVATAGKASGWSTLEGRLALIEQRLADLQQGQDQNAADLRQERDERIATTEMLLEHVRVSLAAVTGQMRAEQQRDEEINASALPVLLVGAALSAFAGLFAGHLTCGLMAVYAGVALSLRAIVILDLARPQP